MKFDEKERAQQALALASIEAGQVYRHYKGGLYVVVAVAINEESLEELVVYRSCAHKTTWVRTVKNFTAMVADPDIHDEWISRFMLVT